MEQVFGSVLVGRGWSAIVVLEPGIEAKGPNGPDACEGSRDIVGVGVGGVGFCCLGVVGVVC